jgi:hypothetical protein
MFDKIGRLAEAAASNVSLSRRGFFGQLGRAALGAAGVVGGLLVLPSAAQASGHTLCCIYRCGFNHRLQRRCQAPGSTCPWWGGTCQNGEWFLLCQKTVPSCGVCQYSHC